ncbi:MAG: hypothetical protein ACT4OU_08120 [Hyphomicrobium sp.]
MKVARPLQSIAPMASVAVLVLLAALPWGLPSQDRFFLPLLPVIAIHYWSLRRHALLPEWAAFLAGLALDILTHGPLGYWSLIYLAAHAFAVVSAPVAVNGPVVRLVLLAGAMLGVAILSWAVASLYFVQFADWRPYAVGSILASICAIALLPALRALDGGGRERDNARLARGV